MNVLEARRRLLGVDVYKKTAEEWVCNFIADYGLKIFQSAYEILGDQAWLYVPYELERLVA